MLNYFRLIFNWWNDTRNALRLGGDNNPANLMISLVTILTLLLNVVVVFSFNSSNGSIPPLSHRFMVEGPAYLLFLPLELLYLKVGHTILQACEGLTMRLTQHYGLTPTVEPRTYDPEEILESIIGDPSREALVAGFFAGVGGLMGAIFSNLIICSIFHALGVGVEHPNRLAFSLFGSALIIGGIPGGNFGHTTGRFVHHAIVVIPVILEKKYANMLERRHAYQQARAIVTLNDLPLNLKKNRYLPPEILGIIHSYLINSSEQESFDIINDVMKEASINRLPRFLREIYESRTETRAQELTDMPWRDIELGQPNFMMRSCFFSTQGQQDKPLIKDAEEYGEASQLMLPGSSYPL